MHVISRRKLRDFWERHPESKKSLEAWFKIARVGRYRTFQELKRTFAKADKVGDRVVFDIGGHKYRLVAVVHFNRFKLYVRHVLTHHDYDKGDWKHG